MERKKISVLTQNELETMELYMIGLKNEQISKRLNTSIYSVIKTFKSVIKKLNVSNKMQAAALIATEDDNINLSREFLNYKDKIDKTINLSISIDFKFS